MKFDIITIFPKIFESYFGESIIKRAQKNNLIDIQIHNLRDYTVDKHKTVDDTPYGGGAGMVLKIEPIYRAVQSLKSKINPPIGGQKSKVRIVLFSAKGRKYTQKDARRLSKYDNIIMICGRYEGVDERVAKHIADEEISIGDYVLTGGEIPAMILVDSITRLLPGVLGNTESLKEESFSKIQSAKAADKIQNSVLEYPQYTRPEKFFAKDSPRFGEAGESASGGETWKVPQVLLGGNHKEIENWRKKNAKKRD